MQCSKLCQKLSVQLSPTDITQVTNRSKITCFNARHQEIWLTSGASKETAGSAAAAYIKCKTEHQT